MTISLFKYNCALREDGKIYSTYGEFNEELYNDVIETIGNEPAVFPIRFVFVPVNHLDGVMAQLFVLRHIFFSIKMIYTFLQNKIQLTLNTINYTNTVP